LLSLKIAFRNVFRQKRRTILTALTMFGGFILSALSIGWADGTYSNTIDVFTRNRLGHIQVHKEGYLDQPSLYKTVDDYETIGGKIISIDGVESWTPRLYSAGLASVAEKTAGVRILGIDLDLEEKSTRFSKKISGGKNFSSPTSKEAILGKGLAEILKAQIGDEAVIISQAADGSIANELYTIVGLVESGDNMSDQMDFYLTLKEAQELLALEERVHEIVIIVEKLGSEIKLARQIGSILNEPNLDVAPWQEFARQFYQAMQADVEGMWIMLLVIIIIVAVGVLNTVLMTVLERIREYGLMKAIGTRPFQIIRIIIYEVNIIAMASIIVGAILGLLINHLLSFHGIAMPFTFTYGGVEFSRYYTQVNVRSFLIPAVTILFTASFVSIFPAIKAARTAPTKAMRIH
jgi:ABC-type lipoprotein release transport system permease subunit